MTRIICLANSWKRGNRCIAGIHTIKGDWVRVISDLPDGGIPKEMRLIDGQEPALLDVIDIPLANQTRETFEFERENVSVLPGKWRRTQTIPPGYLFKYLSKEVYILHNDERYIPLSYLEALPTEKRQTLQLVKAVQFSVNAVFCRGKNRAKWEGTLVTEYGKELTATITDPVLIRRLELGYRPQSPCLITVSLSMPWQPEDWEKEENPCWKLLAGVVELSHSNAIA